MPKPKNESPKAEELDNTAVEETTEVNETPEESAIAPVSEAKVVAAVTSNVKTRRVLGLQNHQCTIGNQRVIIEKNVETEISVDAATILSRAGKVLIK